MLSEEQHWVLESRLCFNCLAGAFGAGSEQGKGEVVLGLMGLGGHLRSCATTSRSVQQAHPQQPLPIPKHFQMYPGILKGLWSKGVGGCIPQHRKEMTPAPQLTAR